MLRNSTVIVAAAVMRTCPRAILLAMITMRKSFHGFPFVFHIWVAHGAPLGGPLGHQSSAIRIKLRAEWRRCELQVALASKDAHTASGSQLCMLRGPHMLFCVLPSMFPYGFSSKRETTLSLKSL